MSVPNAPPKPRTAKQSKLARMDEKARAFIQAQFARAPLLHAEMLELWTTFRGLGLPTTDFFTEFTSGKQPSLMQRNWEMLLARHLHLQGHKLSCQEPGPDFSFDLNGTTVWVEAIAPEPTGFPPEWLDDEFSGVRNFPHEQMLLRWTSALDEKWKKLAKYRKKGIVGPLDAYVVAINGCQLSRFPDSRGITQMPFGVEAVFPVGPLVYRVDGDTGRIRDGSISERFHIIKSNNTPIPTTPFLDPDYSGVSAVIGCAAARTYGKPLDIHVVHNPRADVPLPLGVLGGQDDEWIAPAVPGVTDEFELQRVSRS
jgi:type I restriction enzyme S subunit